MSTSMHAFLFTDFRFNGTSYFKLLQLWFSCRGGLCLVRWAKMNSFSLKLRLSEYFITIIGKENYDTHWPMSMDQCRLWESCCYTAVSTGDTCSQGYQALQKQAKNWNLLQHLFENSALSISYRNGCYIISCPITYLYICHCSCRNP